MGIRQANLCSFALAFPIVLDDWAVCAIVISPRLLDTTPSLSLRGSALLTSIQVNPVNREQLFFALNETTHALRFAESAAKRFAIDVDELDTGSRTAASVAYIKNRLTDAQASLALAEEEIGRLINEARVE